MTDHRNHVLTMGDGLAIGQSVAGECPFCLAPEKKFSVTRYEDGLGYLCYRASCNKRGAIKQAGYESLPPVTRVATPVFEPRCLPYTLEPLTGYGLERLGYLQMPFPYGSYSSGPDRIVFLLEDLAGRIRGWTSRTRDKKVTSGKALPGPLYGYYGAAANYSSLWVVEDCLSAIRLAHEGRAAIALLGTHMADAIVDELWDAYPSLKRLYVALDPGAEDAARKIVTRLRFHHGLDAIQVVLPDDIHRLDSATFQNIIEAYK